MEAVRRAVEEDQFWSKSSLQGSWGADFRDLKRIFHRDEAAPIHLKQFWPMQDPSFFAGVRNRFTRFWTLVLCGSLDHLASSSNSGGKGWG